MNSISKRSIKGFAVLVVEDEIMIGLDAQAMLEEAGAELVEVATKAVDALRLISEKPPHAAVLDINLGSGTSFAIADELAARGIPYIFATGYAGQIDLPPQHIHVTVVGKPYTADRLTAGLIAALDQRGDPLM
jgi:CheY-like chemotaxis protein